MGGLDYFTDTLAMVSMKNHKAQALLWKKMALF